MSTISNDHLLLLLEGARAAGASRDGLLKAAGVDANTVTPGGRTPYAAYCALWLEVMTQLKDPSFPFRLAQHAKEGKHGVLQFACLTSSNVGAALHKLRRYVGVHSESLTIDLVEGDVDAQLALRRTVQTPRVSYADEYALALVVLCGRQITGHDWAPTQVSFSHAEPPDTRPHRDFFKAALRFGAPTASLTLGQEVLALPMVKGDAAMSAYFEAQLEQHLSTLTASPPLFRRIQEVVLGQLGEGPPSLERIASELALSPRTLRRQLQKHATSFKALVDQTRLNVARGYLTDSSLSQEDIAFLLGFSEASAFHRAFRRWTGTTPQSLRRSGGARSE